MSGLSGTIVVEPPDPISVNQRLFVLKDMVLDDDTGNAEVDDTMHGIVQSVNGQLTTNEAMRPGKPNCGASPTKVPTERSILH